MDENELRLRLENLERQVFFGKTWNGREYERTGTRPEPRPEPRQEAIVTETAKTELLQTEATKTKKPKKDK